MVIVLTGGPSAGKTSLVEILMKECWDQLVMVPEAATLLFGAGFPRRGEVEQIKCQQRAIYYVQRELERSALLEAKGRSLICDRGSLDSLAYWPEDRASSFDTRASSFFESVGTSLASEIARYDWVIHLETAPQLSYLPSSVRIESEEEARVLDDRIRQAWSSHPRRIIIENEKTFSTKVQRVVQTLHSILGSKTTNSS